MILWIVMGWYVLASVVTLVMYGVDKRAAIRGAWRVPERTLHILEAVGGFPGALVAQGLFRHKRRKVAYVFVLWIIISAHVAGWGVIFWLQRGDS